MRALGAPLALGHIITIELAKEILKALDDAERQRNREVDAAEDFKENDTVYGPFFPAVHRQGIVRGDHEVMTEQDWAVVAKYIRRKVAARLRDVPPLPTYQETLTRDGRLHPIWSSYRSRLISRMVRKRWNANRSSRRADRARGKSSRSPEHEVTYAPFQPHPRAGLDPGL